MSQTDPLRVTVQRDQPPSVAVAHPIAGSQHVGGTVIELRANAVDDVRVTGVDFFVQGNLVGSDSQAPYSFLYESPPITGNEQRWTVRALARDTKGQETSSPEVEFTLGHDELPPVINFAAPHVTRTEAGEDYADVIENSSLILRASGYDNLGITALEVRGLRRGTSNFVLTGDLNEPLSAADSVANLVPGALNAVTWLKQVSLPAFTGASGLSYDAYPVSIRATDAVRNTSTATLIIAVVADGPPEVINISTERSEYLAHETITFTVAATDDVSVDQMRLELFLDGAASPLRSLSQPISPAARNAQGIFTVELPELGITNAAHVIRAVAVSRDSRGQLSSDAHPPVERTIRVLRDAAGPLVAISSPAPGSRLYAGGTQSFEWRAVDESLVTTVRVRRGGNVVSTVHPNESDADGSFNLLLPANTRPAGVVHRGDRRSRPDNDGSLRVRGQHRCTARCADPHTSGRHPPGGGRAVHADGHRDG
ncbi:MAG: hypothetical protein IPG81_18065 [Sandaracinaceae bacterium]|nr:hypothetical protein [Sandaracinaceae bacterium]